jgi:hypothetical protein
MRKKSPCVATISVPAIPLGAMIASFHSAIWQWRTLIQIRDFDPSIHIFSSVQGDESHGAQTGSPLICVNPFS